MEEKRKLEQRLNQLRARIVHAAPPRPERHPKFRNPDAPHQTWSGRGKQPHWIRELLQKGKQLLISGFLSRKSRWAAKTECLFERIYRRKWPLAGTPQGADRIESISS
jgi:hypothetical protein